MTDKLGFSAKVIADSIFWGSRLTTFEVTFPRFLLPEWNTHRTMSRNSASSRAIPVWKKLADVIEKPFVPRHFGINKPGMQSSENLKSEDNEAAKHNWMICRDVAVLQSFILAGGEDKVLAESKGSSRAVKVCEMVKDMMREYPDVVAKMKSLEVGVHKQHANRLIEPYSWHTVIATATHWRNFYALRASKDAQPEIREVAILMARAQMESIPRVLSYGEWHLPYIFEEDRKEISDPILLARISTGRGARVSYLTHDGRKSHQEDLGLTGRLQSGGHGSPFEHPAQAGIAMGRKRSNFDRRWIQYRKMLKHESDFSRLISESSLEEGFRGDKKLSEFVYSLKA